VGLAGSGGVGWSWKSLNYEVEGGFVYYGRRGELAKSKVGVKGKKRTAAVKPGGRKKKIPLRGKPRNWQTYFENREPL